MRFIDEARVLVVSGSGGDGAVSFRREKFVPFGGPDGGDGGWGGDVVLVATTRLNTLLSLRGVPHIKAKNGVHGSGRQMTGAGAPAVEVPVPVGTRVFDEETGEQVVDLTEDEQRYVVAKGGAPGKGNVHFKSSKNRTPRKATPGKPGEEKMLRLELMLMADVGLLGFPNAGKSTLISRLSAARPKVADYPFTTLVPNLGVVKVGLDASFVIADIPGLIRGASEGAGLGHQFLRHVQRTRVLLHLVSLGPDELEAPEDRYRAIREELQRYDPELAQRPERIVLTKVDVADSSPDDGATLEQARERILALADGPREVHVISAFTGEGLKPLLQGVWKDVRAARERAGLRERQPVRPPEINK